MSWQDHANNIQTSLGFSVGVCIIGLADYGVAASTPKEFTPKLFKAKVTQDDGTEKDEQVNENEGLARNWADPSFTKVYFNQQKYMVTTREADSIVCQILGKPGFGLVAYKLKTLIIVGAFNDKMAGGARGAVNAIAGQIAAFKKAGV